MMCTEMNKVVSRIRFVVALAVATFASVSCSVAPTSGDHRYTESAALSDVTTGAMTFVWTTTPDLASTGFFAAVIDAAADRATGSEIDSQNRSYSPAFPLWSDGLAKRRWIQLPAGAQIDTTNFNFWVFPVGTKIWKEFSKVTPGSDSGDGAAAAETVRLVETRYVHKVDANTWEFGTYIWQGDSTRLSGDLGTANLVELAPGISHAAPAFDHCTYCHARGGDPVLGFDAVQLGSQRREGPLPLVGLDLEELITEERVVESTPRYVEITAASDTERKIAGYLQANCAGCHSPAGSVRRFQLDLSLPLDAAGAVDLASAPFKRMIDQPAEIYVPAVPGFPGFQKLIDPGRPESSVLFHRISVRQNPVMMPKIGTSLPDAEFVELVRQWILSMPVSQ